MSQTLSFSEGRVSPLHDVRLVSSPNVDPNLTAKNNLILIDKLADFGYDIEAYTNAKMQPVLDEYNSKQKRDDRKKLKPYCEYLKEENAKLIEAAETAKQQGTKKTIRKPTRLAYEFVLQVGDKDSNGVSDPNTDMALNQQFAIETLEKLQERYPHLDILLATFHGDEPNGTPHLHILCQFTGEGYKQGLSKQISVSKALENDGIARNDNRKEAPFALSRFTEQVKDTIMTDKLHTLFHEDREVLGDKRPHEDIRFFRAKAREEAKALEEKREETEIVHQEARQDGFKTGFDVAYEEASKLASEMALNSSKQLTEALEVVTEVQASTTALNGLYEQKINELDNLIADVKKQDLNPDLEALKDFVRNNVPLGQGKRVIDRFEALEASKKATVEQQISEQEEALKAFLELHSNDTEEQQLKVVKDLKQQMDSIATRGDRNSKYCQDMLADLKAKFEALDGEELIELHKDDNKPVITSNYADKVLRKIDREQKLNEKLAPRQQSKQRDRGWDLGD